MSKKKKITSPSNVNLSKFERVTNTRLDIIKCLSDGHHQHTALEIIKHLKSSNKKLNVATVYNNLKILLSKGIIDVYPNYDSQNQKYELIDQNKFHIHIRDYQNACEKYLDVPNDVLNLIEKVINENGYDIHNLKIEVLVKNKTKK